MRKRRIARRQRVLLFGILAIFACDLAVLLVPRGILRANVERIEAGMCREQVEDLLGGPPVGGAWQHGRVLSLAEFQATDGERDWPPDEASYWILLWAEADVVLLVYFDPGNGTVVCRYTENEGPSHFERLRVYFSQWLP